MLALKARGDDIGSRQQGFQASDQQLAEFLTLTKGGDSVELKLTMPVSDRSRPGRLGSRLGGRLVAVLSEQLSRPREGK